MTTNDFVHQGSSGCICRTQAIVVPFLSSNTFFFIFFKVLDENILKPSREPMAGSANPRSFCVIREPMADPEKRRPNPAESCFSTVFIWWIRMDKVESALDILHSTTSLFVCQGRARHFPGGKHLDIAITCSDCVYIYVYMYIVDTTDAHRFNTFNTCTACEGVDQPTLKHGNTVPCTPAFLTSMCKNASRFAIS